MNKPAYLLGTTVPNFGTIQAVKSGEPRDYLLIDGHGTAAWLDERAIDTILTEVESKTFKEDE